MTGVSRDVEKVVEQCGDKRYTPSTAISFRNGVFEVYWFEPGSMKYVNYFSDLAEAVTDYLLFSCGKGRWKSSGNPGNSSINPWQPSAAPGKWNAISGRSKTDFKEADNFTWKKPPDDTPYPIDPQD